MMTGHRRPSTPPAIVTTADHAIDELYREHALRMVRLAFMLTGDTGVAEEVVQEALLRVWRSWDRLRDTETGGAYLRVTVVNLATSVLRRRGLELRHRIQRIDDAVEIDPGGRLDVLRVISALPPRQRACIALRFYEDLSESDTAKVLGISVGTVKSQTYKALRRLEKVMGGDDVRS